mmetsp:Transcript_3274/g.6546  ORF Transcript_3274/g.6546 Transcript_3274/m.6546 type:complete len:205 (-) Transcript_3274:124-738(-)
MSPVRMSHLWTGNASPAGRRVTGDAVGMGTLHSAATTETSSSSDLFRDERSAPGRHFAACCRFRWPAGSFRCRHPPHSPPAHHPRETTTRSRPTARRQGSSPRPGPRPEGSPSRPGWGGDGGLWRAWRAPDPGSEKARLLLQCLEALSTNVRCAGCGCARWSGCWLWLPSCLVCLRCELRHNNHLHHRLHRCPSCTSLEHPLST